LRHGPAAGRFAAIRQFGIEFIEPQFDIDARDADDLPFLEGMRQDISGAGLAVWSAHSPFGTEVDISSSDPAIRTRGVQAILRAARGALFLGAKVMVVHCGDLCDETADRKDPLSRSLEALQQIVEGCTPLGVQIALVNLPPDHLTSSAEELMRMVEAFPAERVGVCLDTGHANMAGILLETIERAGPRIVTVHLHDNDGSADQHRVPGEGTIDWIAVRDALARSNYAGPLMFEVDKPGAYAEMMAATMAAARKFTA
jgi:sugar phosphate isomerase/epimerase